MVEEGKKNKLVCWIVSVEKNERRCNARRAETRVSAREGRKDAVVAGGWKGKGERKMRFGLDGSKVGTNEVSRCHDAGTRCGQQMSTEAQVPTAAPLMRTPCRPKVQQPGTGSSACTSASFRDGSSEAFSALGLAACRPQSGP